MLQRQPIKISDLDKIHISVENNYKYLQWDSKKCQFPLFPIISQWEL